MKLNLLRGACVGDRNTELYKINVLSVAFLSLFHIFVLKWSFICVIRGGLAHLTLDKPHGLVLGDKVVIFYPVRLFVDI